METKELELMTEEEELARKKELSKLFRKELEEDRYKTKESLFKVKCDYCKKEKKLSDHWQIYQRTQDRKNACYDCSYKHWHNMEPDAKHYEEIDGVTWKELGMAMSSYRNMYWRNVEQRVEWFEHCEYKVYGETMPASEKAKLLEQYKKNDAELEIKDK